MPGPATIARRLEKCFVRVYRTRMTDVPLVNEKLSVKTVGFRRWEGGTLGILVTPWSMNLIRVADGHELEALPPPGNKTRHRFPSGSYEFIVSDEAGVGRYEMCSLFSPMFEFDNQATAVATAKEVMTALMKTTRSDTDTTEETPATGKTENSGSRPGISARLRQPMSRRDLLRVSFLRGGGVR
jgi:[NiFe] hydrogenase assembly HybE family chaperone